MYSFTARWEKFKVSCQCQSSLNTCQLSFAKTLKITHVAGIS